MKKKQWIALLLFGSIPMLSLLYLFVLAPTGVDANGFPNWIIGFLVIEMLFCGFMWWFTQNVWE